MNFFFKLNQFTNMDKIEKDIFQINLMNMLKYRVFCVQVFDQTTNDTIRRRIIENGLDRRFNLFKVMDEKWPH